MNQSENLKSFNPDTHYYKDEFSLQENKKEKKIEKNEKNETKKDKLYSLKSTKTNEIQSSNISLKTIFISQARVHPILLPMKYRNFIDKMHVLTKCNVGVLFFTIYTLFKRDRFVITQTLYNKSVFAFSIWYFSFLFLCLKMDSTYAEAYENVSSRYTEEEIVKLINDYSKTFKISV